VVDDAGRGLRGTEDPEPGATGVGALREDILGVARSAVGTDEILFAAWREVEALGVPFSSDNIRVTSAKSLLVTSPPEPPPNTRNAFSNAVFASEYSSRAI
jgi:hypothetical protein